MTVSRGGSREEISIEPVLNDNGKPVHSGGGYVIEDRAGVRRITISGGIVAVEAIVHGDDADAMVEDEERLAARGLTGVRLSSQVTGFSQKSPTPRPTVATDRTSLRSTSSWTTPVSY